MFLDGGDAKVRNAVNVLFAGEKVRADDLLPSPDISEAERAAFFGYSLWTPLCASN